MLKILATAVMLVSSAAFAKTVDLGIEDHPANDFNVKNGYVGGFRVSLDTGTVIRDSGIALVTVTKRRVYGEGTIHKSIERWALACGLHEWDMASIKTFDVKDHLLRSESFVIKLGPINGGHVQTAFDALCAR